jgi:hypothetical protein
MFTIKGRESNKAPSENQTSRRLAAEEVDEASD